MSDAEEQFAFQLRAVSIAHEREVRFDPTRKWRADFQVGGHILIEIDGGTWTGGRHTSGAGYERDCEKLNEATILGFRVLRFTPGMVEDGRALKVLERALKRAMPI